MPFSDRLKLAWELKQTVFGREFHTLITQHTQKFWRVLLAHLALYSLWAWPLVWEDGLKEKRSSTFTSISPPQFSQCSVTLLSYISSEKCINILALEIASRVNQYCDYCIGTLLFPITRCYSTGSRRSHRCCTRLSKTALKWLFELYEATAVTF